MQTFFASTWSELNQQSTRGHCCPLSSSDSDSIGYCTYSWLPSVRTHFHCAKWARVTVDGIEMEFCKSWDRYTSTLNLKSYRKLVGSFRRWTLVHSEINSISFRSMWHSYTIFFHSHMRAKWKKNASRWIYNRKKKRWTETPKKNEILFNEMNINRYFIIQNTHYRNTTLQQTDSRPRRCRGTKTKTTKTPTSTVWSRLGTVVIMNFINSRSWSWS